MLILPSTPQSEKTPSEIGKAKQLSDSTQYKDIASLSIDKIGLQLNSDNINTDLIKPYRTGFLSILHWSGTVRIMVHAEYYATEPNLGKRCLIAILELLHAGIFIDSLAKKISTTIMMSSVAGYPGWEADVLSNFFYLAEWETNFDFFDVPVVAFTHPESFHPEEDTIYSNDSRKDRKDKIKSFIAISRPYIKKQETRPYYRIKFTHDKPNTQDLSFDLLRGTIPEAYRLLLPSIVRILHRRTKPEHLQFYGYAIQHAPWWFRDLLEASGWYYPETNALPKPRRAKKS